MVKKKIKQDDKEINNKDSSSLTQNLNKIKQKIKELDYYKILRHVSIAVIFLFIFFAILSKINMLPVYWNLTYMFYFMVFVITLFLVQKINKIPEKEREKSGMIYIFSYLFLLTLIIFTANQFLNRQIILDYMHHLTALSISFGFLTFYSYRNKVEKEIEQEKVNEDKAEEKRAKEFDNKFPKLAFFNFNYHIKDNWKNKKYLISVLRALLSPFIWLARLPYSLVKWMYKEGWAFSIPFVIIAVIFIGIKIAMPIVYTGSYIDEYNHIISGIEFFKTGHFAEVYKGEYYDRGAYVSFLVGLFFKLFGRTIFVAKMVPATIGVIDFFLLYFIAKKIIEKKRYILLLLIIYTFSPWIIFNHFYIRMYVFYELFILLISFLSIKIIETIKQKKTKEIRIYLIIMIIINLINLLLTNDTGSNLILIFSSITLLIIFLIKFKFKKWDYIIKIILITILTIISLLYLDPLNKLKILFSQTLTFTTPLNLKYLFYFFQLNLLFTIFFFISLVNLKNLKKRYGLIIISSVILFGIHLISSPDLQILRGIMYLLPMYFLGATLSISNYKLKIGYKILVIFILVLIIFNNYPKDFLRQPNIPGEIFYGDYQKISIEVLKDLDDDTIIITEYPQMFRFYNPHLKNKIYVLRDNEGSYHTKGLKYNFEGKEYYTFSNDEIITNAEMLNEIIKKNNKIFILSSDDFYNSWTTIDSKEIIKSNFKIITKFKRVSLYKKFSN